ncbi:MULTISPECIES: bifunctional phosphatase PAP2/diacylglycerol kinase family protein [unclassified Arthrobacter]|uniref:bifunctional phosphatase PAP2/diacylglycerol kinase family protein n=1 Tax=unclassified Arthrobacter TaxID=235627 RepID=UPI002E067A59|nr:MULTISPECIES: phosphatase PAP2 family protein [unclassified Arthrobacter]MEC5190781.1 diacylglycerol kinase family enzyme/membrane-associated phospholipid phosphatase [Arthrobacter sp. MP_M4]MEC5204393.1 diacylglycerol kinase family enzyme/membrane-associated phospholipid phosphatase [Arthrobacter sp. MP_M7]
MRSLLRKVRGRLGAFDRKIVRAVSGLPGGDHDTFFRRLSAAANQGKLWFGFAAVMGLFPGRTRRAAVHGVLAQAVASGVTNLVFKTLLPRTRPLPEHLPSYRFVHPQPSSSSMPSGHSASAVAFALGVGLLRPALGAALAPVAAGVAYSRVHTGAHWPSDVFFGSAIGAGSALITRCWWPVRPPFPPTRRTAVKAAELPEGAGLGIAVNTLGGSYSKETAAALQKIFPKAHIREVAQDEDLIDEIARVALRPGVAALGVWGGDGTVGTAAAVAVGNSLPLLVLPGGTLNHFARDAGTPTLAAAVAAATGGEAARADLGSVAVERGLPDRPELVRLTMLNTASIGLYPNLVRRREMLQPALGKPLAGVIAMFRTFAAERPTTLIVDGVRHKLWILYVGRGRYFPRDHAPLIRPVLDDGVLDLRMITADESFARLRLLWSVLTGTVATSRITHLSESSTIRVEPGDTTMVLAVDGEVMPGVRSVEFSVLPGALTYYSPAV